MLTKFTSPSEGIEGHRHRPRSQVKKKPKYLGLRMLVSSPIFPFKSSKRDRERGRENPKWAPGLGQSPTFSSFPQP